MHKNCHTIAILGVEVFGSKGQVIYDFLFLHLGSVHKRGLATAILNGKECAVVTHYFKQVCIFVFCCQENWRQIFLLWISVEIWFCSCYY